MGNRHEKPTMPDHGSIADDKRHYRQYLAHPGDDVCQAKASNRDECERPANHAGFHIGVTGGHLWWE